MYLDPVQLGDASRQVRRRSSDGAPVFVVRDKRGTSIVTRPDLAPGYRRAPAPKVDMSNVGMTPQWRATLDRRAAAKQRRKQLSQSGMTFEQVRATMIAEGTWKDATAI